MRGADSTLTFKSRALLQALQKLFCGFRPLHIFIRLKERSLNSHSRVAVAASALETMKPAPILMLD